MFHLRGPLKAQNLAAYRAVRDHQKVTVHSQYYAEPLVKLRVLVAALCSLDDSGSSDGGSLCSDTQVLTAQVTACRHMDESREFVIENSPVIKSLLINLRTIILRSQLQATGQEKKASGVVSGNRAGGVR